MVTRVGAPPSKPASVTSHNHTDATEDGELFAFGGIPSEDEEVELAGLPNSRGSILPKVRFLILDGGRLTL
jgi:hypothetical protein